MSQNKTNCAACQQHIADCQCDHCFMMRLLRVLVPRGGRKLGDKHK